MIVFLFLLAASAVLTMAGFLGRFGWLFDLASYFRAGYFLIQLSGVIFFAVFRRIRALLAVLILAGVNLVLIIPFYVKPYDRHAENRDDLGKFDIVTVNVNTVNRDYAVLLRYIRQVSPDILALDEIDKTWFDFLGQHLHEYKFTRYSHCGECEGIGIFSKGIPFKDKIFYFSESQIPALLLTFKNSQDEYALMFTHSICPSKPEYFFQRNRHLEQLALRIREYGCNFLFIGDLNTGPWSYYYDMFLTLAGLRDGRLGFGLASTWKANFFLSAMIDQCLIKGGLVILGYKVGPDIGSDHRPLYCEVGVKRI